jgi:hypothetical protein
MRALPLIFSAALALGAPAAAGVLDEAAIHAEPQYYLMSLPQAPVGEIAEAVLGEALGLPYKVDPGVDAEMRFQLDGVYAPKALAQEFGYRLWNVGVALVEKPSDGLWLIPRDQLPAALAQGATLVSPLAAGETAARRQSATLAATPAAPTPDPAVPDWGWLGWLLGGWAAGAASVMAAMRLRKPRPAPVAALLPAPPAASPPRVDDPAADDLVIPVFAGRNP